MKIKLIILPILALSTLTGCNRHTYKDIITKLESEPNKQYVHTQNYGPMMTITTTFFYNKKLNIQDDFGASIIFTKTKAGGEPDFAAQLFYFWNWDNYTEMDPSPTLFYVEGESVVTDDHTAGDVTDIVYGKCPNIDSCDTDIMWHESTHDHEEEYVKVVARIMLERSAVAINNYTMAIDPSLTLW